ncbi:MAG: sigma-70 family RNA polymerase sigma factor [Clostridium sp.]|uniref:sigma-70 family RNA polymerase sigma factor n=1 Tax=Clostridium sp. TaxID=1506 RepID=UPI003F3D662F
MVDEVKVKRAIKGSDDDFYYLITLYKEKIYRTAYAYLKNEDAALEIFQEVVCKAYVSIKNLKEPRYFETWLIRIAINLATTAYQKNKKIIYIDDKTLVNHLGTEDLDNDDRLDLLQAIDTLPDKHKEVIVLKYFNDLTVNEISKY